MFDFHAQNETPDSGDGDPLYDLITVDAFYRKPRFWLLWESSQSTTVRRMGRTGCSKHRRLIPPGSRIPQWITIGIMTLLWLVAAILFYAPKYQPYPIPDLLLRTLLALIPAFSLPILTIESQRLFRLNLYLVHPEAPDPHPMPVHTDPRELDLALRIVDPYIRHSLLKDLPSDSGRQVFPMCPDGRGAPGRGDVLVQQCNRLLRYAFFSRLPASDPTSDKNVNVQKSPSKALPAGMEESEKPVNLPRDIRSAQRHSLMLYIHYRQLRWYFTMILFLVFWDLTCRLRGVFVPPNATPPICYLKLYVPLALLGSIVWLGCSLKLYRQQRRDIATWFDQFDPPVTTAPTYELDQQQRRWTWIRPRFFAQRSDWEFATGFDKPVSIAVTVMLVLYLNIVKIFA